MSCQSALDIGSRWQPQTVGAAPTRIGSISSTSIPVSDVDICEFQMSTCRVYANPFAVRRVVEQSDFDKATIAELSQRCRYLYARFSVHLNWICSSAGIDNRKLVAEEPIGRRSKATRSSSREDWNWWAVIEIEILFLRVYVSKESALRARDSASKMEGGLYNPACALSWILTIALLVQVKLDAALNFISQISREAVQFEP